MALRLSSPGINVREVDLTRGGVNATVNIAAGIAGPFQQGPVNEVTRITTEKELVEVFGGPGAGLTDYHYETWYAASNFLSYGGQLDVVRANGSGLVNANAGVGIASSTTLNIENYDDYNNNHTTDTTFYWAARNPGFWADGFKVVAIDNAADQRISGIFTTNVGAADTGFISAHNIQVGYAVTQRLDGVSIGIGTTSSFGVNDYLKGIVTGVGASFIDVKVVSTVIAGVETARTYQENSALEFKPQPTKNGGRAIGLSSSTLGDVGIVTGTASCTDWYSEQNVLTAVADGGQDLTTLKWRTVLPKPATNSYVSERNGSNDSLNVVVIDTKGSVTGAPGSILEKFGNLSKAKDAEVSPNKAVYYKDYLALNSQYIFAGTSPAVDDSHHNTQALPSGFSSGVTPVTGAAGAWGQDARDVKFNSLGNKSYSLLGGKDYSGSIGYFEADLGNILEAYDKLADTVTADIRFLLQGGAHKSREEEQAKAQKLISICESRKDCVAFISPNRDSVVNVTNATTQLNNVLEFFAPLSSSSYGIFDSGYQYAYDRFNKRFNYIPLSNDVAGLCVRTDINQFPWFSPAGTTRGALANAVKLAFNPGQAARDRLYSSRINPVVTLPGSGTVLYGDKTALAYESAFDRINVRRLFITIEKAIESAANAQLFEFNDAGTRINFLNIVEPYLRDVQAKRGITDFLVVCDDTNNTPDVIDRNEFIADIFVKPARSINYIGLTFVATRTGVSFQEVVGNV